MLVSYHLERIHLSWRRGLTLVEIVIIIFLLLIRRSRFDNLPVYPLGRRLHF